MASGAAAVAVSVAGSARAADSPKRVGVLVGIPQTKPSEDKVFRDDINRGFAAQGWTEGRVELDYHYGNNDPALNDKLARDLVASRPDVLLGFNTIGTAALVKATRDLPIVFAHVSDPVGIKFVKSFADPGGNVTGFSNFEASMGGKWLELLKLIAPKLTRVRMIANPAMLSGLFYVPAFRDAAGRLGLEFDVVEVHDLSEVEATVAEAASAPGTGLVFSSDGYVYSMYDPIIAAVNAHRVPAMYPFRQYPLTGGLVAYSVNEDALYEGAAEYAGRILNGARLADLPVQGPSKFDLIVNLGTAAAQGLTVPPELLIAATQVIE